MLSFHWSDNVDIIGQLESPFYSVEGGGATWEKVLAGMNNVKVVEILSAEYVSQEKCSMKAQRTLSRKASLTSEETEVLYVEMRA